MNDYCNGIAYATGYFANDEKEKYLVVRNLDKWYVENIAKETGYSSYESMHNFERDGASQWTVKARNIHELPNLDEIKILPDFCRSYIEIHGTLDLRSTKDKKGNLIRTLRLRIYGKENILDFINTVLPAKKKKIQYIKNIIDKNYIGETCALYYQSRSEILDILNWIDRDPRNKSIWNCWNDVLQK